MAELLGNRYRLGDSLNRGPTGQVYFAVDADDHEFALKVLRAELVDEPDVVARVAGYVADLQQLSGPHLVRVLDVVTAADTVAIVMERVRGGDLRQHLSETGTVLPAEVARIGAEIAGALADLHSFCPQPSRPGAGYLHLDVKPRNILLDQFTAPRAARLTDLGVAGLAMASAYARRAILTAEPHYVAPELTTPNAVPTPAADLYSLGVVLYELCCGVTPFAGLSARELAVVTASSEPGRPDGIPDELWRVIVVMLARNPQDRPASADQVASNLNGLVSTLEHQPCALRLTVPPPPRQTVPTSPGGAPPNIGAGWLTTNITGPMFATGGPMRRRRRRLVLLGLVILVAVGGLVGWAVAGSGGGSSASGPSGGGGLTQPNQIPTGAAPVTTVTTTVPPMTVAPNLIGKTLAQAQDAVPSAVTLKTIDTINQTASDGTVIDQDPKPGAPVNGTIQVTVARQAVTVYLDSLTPATGSWRNADSAEVAGQLVTHALITSLGDCRQSEHVEYNVSKGYRQLVATAGVEDNSPDSATKVQVQIFGDGRQLQNTTMTFGTSYPVNIDLSGVLRLRIEWQDISHSNYDCNNGDSLVFGEA
ncbi:MAG TPA: protein kinase, partial [Pseudonocardiaceae bacterium]